MKTIIIQRRAIRGFTLIELMITVALVGILSAIAYPSYLEYIKRSNREGAQSDLVELAATQEKIFLNSNQYISNVTSAYDGTTAGGLGSGAKTRNGVYNLSATVADNSVSFIITATPVASSTQVSDGTLTISSTGARTWAGTKTW